MIDGNRHGCDAEDNRGRMSHMENPDSRVGSAHHSRDFAAGERDSIAGEKWWAEPTLRRSPFYLPPAFFQFRVRPAWAIASWVIFVVCVFVASQSESARAAGLPQ